MTAILPWHRLGRLADHESLQPDLGRAIRATIAFMVPLLLAAAGWLPWEMTFVALTAQNIAMVDVRGPYALRFGLLLAMAAILTGAVGLGALASTHLLAAAVGMGFMAVCGGLWRHLNSDYGPSMAISSILVFLLALNTPAGAPAAGHHMVAALAGGAWGVILQVVNWPFRPQHPPAAGRGGQLARCRRPVRGHGPGRTGGQRPPGAKCRRTRSRPADHAR